jgi:hypothetical protein
MFSPRFETNFSFKQDEFINFEQLKIKDGKK